METLQEWGQGSGEVFGKNRGRSKADTWLRNEDVKEAVSRQKHTRQCVKKALRRIRDGIKA